MPPKKVLIIEDEKDVNELFGKVFADYKDIQLLTASKGEEGIQIAEKEKPGVILLDLRMPDITGEEILRRLKPLLPGTKFLVMTGWEDGETKSRIEFGIGVDGYYSKPINLEEVMNKILECTEGSHDE